MPTTKISLPSKAIIKCHRTDKELSGGKNKTKQKLKEFISTKPVLQGTLEGLL